VNWEQLKTILWLRWRLTRNQWMRGGGLGAAFAAIVAIALALLCGISFAGALAGGVFGLGDAKPTVIWGIWFGLTLGFLFFWLMGLLIELQRSESIDLQRLMHLPVALGQMFVVNYLASHLVFSIMLFVPAMMGLAIGLVISRGPAMLLLAPLALGLVFMVTAWTYCLRGWLATLMSNPRRRRSVIMGITAAFILLAQGPNLYFNVLHRHQNLPAGITPEEAQRRRNAENAGFQQAYQRLLVAQKFIPPLWLPLGARELAEGRALPALFGIVGCMAIGALGLRRAYRSTIQFYSGGAGGKTAVLAKPQPVTAVTAKSAKDGRHFLELRLPGVPEQASALALATFRSMLRAPEIKMAWASSFIVTFIFAMAFLMRSTMEVGETAKPFIATGVAAFSVFMLVQSFAN
jgi:ABC-2 type transport system permease protein